MWNPWVCLSQKWIERVILQEMLFDRISESGLWLHSAHVPVNQDECAHARPMYMDILSS